VVGEGALRLGRCLETWPARGDPFLGTVGELADGGARFAEDGRDLVVRVGEGLAQDVSGAFLRSQPLQEDQDSQGDLIRLLRRFGG